MFGGLFAGGREKYQEDRERAERLEEELGLLKEKERQHDREKAERPSPEHKEDTPLI